MNDYLNQICDDNPDGCVVALKFKSDAQPVQGAIRRFKETGLFELMGPGQIADPQNPRAVKNVLVSNVFAADAVERVLVFHDVPQPQVVTPGQGGILIQT